MPAQDPDPPSRAGPVSFDAEQDFIRALSERPVPPEGLDTTIDDPEPVFVSETKTTQPADDSDELVGTTLSKTYKIVRMIGEGGMGRVYEARHTRIASKRFAIKMLHPELLRQPEVLQRFQREAEAAASIDNSHVVGVYDVDQTRDGRPFLVTEYLEGTDLGERIKASGPMPIGAVVRIVRQVCKALIAAHDKGVVHRDIKPANVFLTGDPAAPWAKVLDFGISRIAAQGGNTLTKTGMIMGTPAFMSPEQARGSRVDHRADIYALGAVLYTALTGHEPFEMEEPSATLAAVLTRDPPRPRSWQPSIPEHLELMVQRAMAKEPEERYPDVASLDTALAPYDSGEPLPAAGGLATERNGAHGLSHIRATEQAAHTIVAQEALRAKLARPQLVLLGAGGLLALVFLLTSAIGSALRLVRDASSLSTVQAALILIAVTATLATPVGLAVYHVRRNVWQNSAKVLALADVLRAPLATAVAVYGVLAMCIRVLEIIAVRSEAGLQWAVWDLLLALFSLGGVGMVFLLRRLMQRPLKQDDPRAARRRAMLPAIMITFGVLVAMATVVAAAIQRADEPTDAAEGTTEPPEETTAATSSASSALLPPPPPGQRATPAELDQAKREGADALEALHQRYPKDTRVLQALVLAYGQTTSTLDKALEHAETLFRLAPDAAKDESIYRLIYKAANSGDPVADKALELMASAMGPQGPDLLYEIWVAEGPKAAQAQKLLEDKKVLQLGTPALRIAVALRNAKGCKAKGDLVQQAAADGDKRAVAILKPLTVGTRRGCGFLDLSSCPPRCAAQAAEMRKAIATIEERSK